MFVREVNFYRLPNGQCPVEDFLDSLSGKQAQKVTWVLKLIENLEFIPAQYFKKLEDRDLWEVRAQLGSNDFRLLGFFDGGALVILTNGFLKKSQRTPEKDIQLAEQRRMDYLSRR